MSKETYVESILTKDEKILYEGQLHWAVYIQGVVLFLIGLFFLSGINATQRNSAFVGFCSIFFALAILSLVKALTLRQTTELAITNKRVISKFGFIRRTTFEIILNKIEGVQLHQSVLGRVLGYSNLVVKGTGTGNAPIAFISNSKEFRNKLDTLLHDINS